LFPSQNSNEGDPVPKGVKSIHKLPKGWHRRRKVFEPSDEALLPIQRYKGEPLSGKTSPFSKFDAELMEWLDELGTRGLYWENFPRDTLLNLSKAARQVGTWAHPIWSRLTAEEQAKTNIQSVTNLIMRHLALEDVAAYAMFFLEEMGRVGKAVFEKEMRDQWPSVDSAAARMARLIRFRLTRLDLSVLL
jgi:hypothetical protein